MVHIWIDISIEKLENSKQQKLSESGETMVRLLNSFSELCACKGFPQKTIQG